MYYDVATAISQGKRDYQEDAVVADFAVGVPYGFAWPLWCSRIGSIGSRSGTALCFWRAMTSWSSWWRRLTIQIRTIRPWSLSNVGIANINLLIRPQKIGKGLESFT